MWKIEIINTDKSESPGKCAKVLYSKWPNRDALITLEQTAIMTRLQPSKNISRTNPLLKKRREKIKELLACIKSKQDSRTHS